MLDEKRVKRIIKENEPYLAVLEEYDRTGRLLKASYKERANFTIDAELLQHFRQLCKSKGYSMSAQIESFLRDWLKRQEQR